MKKGFCLVGLQKLRVADGADDRRDCEGDRQGKDDCVRSDQRANRRIRRR